MEQRTNPANPPQWSPTGRSPWLPAEAGEGCQLKPEGSSSIEKQQGFLMQLSGAIGPSVKLPLAALRKHQK